MYLYIALIWLIFGILVQAFWNDLEPVMRVRPDRTVVGVVCAILVIYNLMRWRMTRVDRWEPPPTARRDRKAEEEYDPNLDFAPPDERKPRDERNDSRGSEPG